QNSQLNRSCAKMLCPSNTSPHLSRKFFMRRPCASVCKDWTNSVVHYTNGAKKAHQHLASVRLKLPGGNFFAIYLNTDSLLKSGGFTSSALRVFVTKRYREISKGIEMPETQFSDVSGNFAQRLVTASRTLGALPAKVAEIELVNAVHNQFGALAGVELLGADFASFAGIKLDQYNLIKGLYDLLQNTQLPSALPGELTEPQTVCYELLKALKSYLVLKRESSLSRSDYYRPNEQLIFNFLKGPDFPSNFMATKEEVSTQINHALTLTKALMEKRKAEAVDMLIAVRSALLA
ncbi:MAG: hypothetical protein NT128_00105, partial [Proteobacteria bacterium]|nr:hypothetical protein [Pseudomonadota bacterium]